MGVITLNVTDEQEKFLKLFAEKQGRGMKDNRETYKPMHIVQNLAWDSVPYSEELEDYYDRADLYFTTDDDCDEWFGSEVDAVKEYYHCINETCLIEIKSFTDVQYEKMEDANGVLVDITTYDDYFAAYNVPVNISWRMKRYISEAYFFILEEAKKYMDYQNHNLTDPRIYTVSSGYGNNGEYEHFYTLLQLMGYQLINEENRKKGLFL